MAILDNITKKFPNITKGIGYNTLNKKYGTLELTPTTPNTQNGTNTALSVNNPVVSQNSPNMAPPAGNTPITSASIKPKSKLELPVATPYTSPLIADAQNQIQNSKTASELAFEQSKTEKDTNISETQKLLEDMGIVKGKSGQYAEEAGVNANEDQLNEINNALMVENRNLANITEKYLNDPSLHGGVGTRLAQKANADSARKQADLLVSQAILQGNVDRAIKIAKQKVDDELAPIQAEIDGLTLARDLNKDSWSNAEKTKLDNIIYKEQSALKETSDNKKLGTEMIVNAQGYGATSDIVKKAQEILNNGGSQVDVAMALGKYSTDPLDRSIKAAQLRKLDLDNAANDPEAQNAIMNSITNEKDPTKLIANFFKSNPKLKTNQDINNAAAVVSSINEFSNSLSGDKKVKGYGFLGGGFLPESLKSQKGITNKAMVSTVEGKLQQWLSGAALSKAQEKLIEKMVPERNDTDKTVKNKLNQLTNYMLSDIKGRSTAQGALFEYIPVDLFSEKSTETNINTAITQAVSNGYESNDILEQVKLSYPDKIPLIEEALNQGYSPEDIISQLAVN